MVNYNDKNTQRTYSDGHSCLLGTDKFHIIHSVNGTNNLYIKFTKGTDSNNFAFSGASINSYGK
jgi:hypothetical protein